MWACIKNEEKIDQNKDVIILIDEMALFWHDQTNGSMPSRVWMENIANFVESVLKFKKST